MPVARIMSRQILSGPAQRRAAFSVVKIPNGTAENPFNPPSDPRNFEKGVRMLRQPDVASLVLMLTLSGGLAGLSHVAGFSMVAAALVGAATATIGLWAVASEP